MYGLVKTHKANNPVRIITSGCNTAVENLSIFVEKILYKEVERLPSRIKDTSHMLDIIDNLNDSDLPENSVLVSFDVVNMFPSIDNESGITAVKKVLNGRESKNPPTECILEALRLCLECNNSVFNDKNFIQTDGTARGPHMSCSYSDIAMAHFDNKAQNYTLKPTVWKRFRDDVFSVWTHNINTLPAFLDYLNNIDSTGKIKFTMQIADENGLEFLDLKLKMNEKNKIIIDVFSKPTNSFTYVMPSTCYPSSNINNIPRGIALRLKRICDSDEKFTVRSNEYKNYLIARDYKPKVVEKHFSEISNLTRAEARQIKPKQQDNDRILFATTYNPMLPNMRSLIKKHLPVLHSDSGLKNIFPENSICTVFKRNRNLKEILSPSLYTRNKNEKKSYVIKNFGKCDICKHYLISDNTFTCKVTNKKYYINNDFDCNYMNVIYLISCTNCNEQYVGSAIDFKKRFRIHKSDINTKKDRCGVARHFTNKCRDPQNPHAFLKIQPIEQVRVKEESKLDDTLWHREKYWQALLFTNSHRMNSMADLYNKKRKGCRKK